MGRYAGMYVARHVGDDIKLGLDRLSNMLASVPERRLPHAGQQARWPASTVDLPAENMLVVNAGSIERNNEKIKASMKANMEWIKRTMDASGLVAAGPMRIISTEIGPRKLHLRCRPAGAQGRWY